MSISGPHLVFLQSQIMSSLLIYVFQETDNNVCQNCGSLIGTSSDPWWIPHVCALSLKYNVLLKMCATPTDLVVINCAGDRHAN